MLSSSKITLAKLASILKGATDGPRKKAVFYYASSSILCQCLRFLGVLITTRAIPPAQFGLFAEAILVMSIAGLFRDIGQSGALVAYQGQDVRYVFFNFQMNLFLGSATAVLILGLYLAPALIPIELQGFVWLLAANPFLESLTQTNSLMLQKQLRFKILGIVEICSLLTWLTTVFLMLNRVSGFLVLLGAQVAENLCRCLLLFIVARSRFAGFATGNDLQHYYFYQFVRPVVPMIVLQTLLSRTDYLLLGAFSTINELGTYERLNQFSRIPISLTVNLCDKGVDAFLQPLSEQSSGLGEIGDEIDVLDCLRCHPHHWSCHHRIISFPQTSSWCVVGRSYHGIMVVQYTRYTIDADSFEYDSVF